MSGSDPHVKRVTRGLSRLRLRSDAGVTILEVTVVVAVIGIVLGGIYLLLISNQRVYERGEVSFDLHTNARLVMPAVTRALMSAGLDPTQDGDFGFVDNAGAGYVPIASGSELTFTLDANGDGVLQNNSEERQGFRLSAAGPPFTIEQMAIDGAGGVTWVPMARDIESLQFFYFDTTGAPLPNPATPPYTLDVTQRGLIRRIVVQVTLSETGEGELGREQLSYTLSSGVTPRNLRGL
ncbi:MAG: type II secretion system protein [Candidatus Methylomirabilales bacterium]